MIEEDLLDKILNMYTNLNDKLNELII